ncbi:MAG: hypothetical protein JSS75_05215 [Bacteroidetes bacterium]|nr:hypothetical protein [Bacteroidota bacterium]
MRWTVTLTIILTAVAANAQEGYEHLSPIAHGAGRTYAINSHGLSAVGLNPALLDPEGSNRFEFRVLPISSFGLEAGASFRNSSDISKVFAIKNANIADSDRRTITNLFLDEKLSGRADFEVLGALYQTPSIGTFALTWTTHVALRTDIPQEFLKFFVTAESQLLQFEGSFSNFDLQGMWYSEYSASYSRHLVDAGSTSDPLLRSIRVGAAAKYVVGIAYVGLDPTNSFAYSFINGGTSIKVNYIFRSAYGDGFDPNKVPTHFSLGFLTSNSAGSGYGFDLGLAGDLITSDSGRPVLGVAASVTDIGAITWTSNATERVADNLTRKIYASGTIDQLNDSLKVLSGVLHHVASFTTPLPTMLRIASRLDMDEVGMQIGSFETSASMEYDAGLTSTVGSLNHPRLGLGLILNSPSSTASLRLAAGYFIQSGSSDLTLGVGTTLFERVAIDLASAHITDIFKSGAARTDAALSFRVQL